MRCQSVCDIWDSWNTGCWDTPPVEPRRGSYVARAPPPRVHLVIWNSSSSHYKVALQTLEESACGECRCERPADRVLGAECAGASVLGEASPSSPSCPVAT